LSVLGHKLPLLPFSVDKPNFGEVIIFLDSSSFVLVAQVLDIVQTAINNGNFQTLVTALTAANLVTTLQGPGPFTVFAPTDAAFSKLPNGTVVDLLKPENIEKLADILKYHVIGGRVTSGDINMMTLPAQVVTLEGGTVTVTKDGNNIKIDDATVITADVSTTNGIIHIIDTVLIPAPSSATPFYVNQGFFTVFMSTILFSCLFSI
jgi:uncharacterized surface protein with fasciclin (FAS1) repeats